MRGNPYRAFGALFVAVTLVALSACVTGQTPEARADEQFVKFTIAEKRAADIMQDPRVSDDVKIRIQELDREATPIVEKMDAATEALKRIRVEKPEDVPAAIHALNELINQAAPLIAAYIRRTKP